MAFDLIHSLLGRLFGGGMEQNRELKKVEGVAQILSSADEGRRKEGLIRRSDRETLLEERSSKRGAVESLEAAKNGIVCRNKLFSSSILKKSS
ncbi:hypothetical protein CDAR_471171 [Caerostris darwini]|uniref:Uncharacterized protein n=1 Tax=Caerostris darwini TaxID=1538125 RepID=A0AAV4QPY7_9ARAC|nr:hypothetical protein CDAR_471171 [Caerostris darwini]